MQFVPSREKRRPILHHMPEILLETQDSFLFDEKLFVSSKVVLPKVPANYRKHAVNRFRRLFKYQINFDEFARVYSAASWLLSKGKKIGSYNAKDALGRDLFVYVIMYDGIKYELAKKPNHFKRCHPEYYHIDGLSFCEINDK